MDSIIFGDLFREIIRKKHGMEVDFDSIEEKLDHLRGGKSLAYSDLEIIGDEKCWPFKKYWMWPSKKQVKQLLKNTRGWLKDLPKNEEWTIGELNGIFKNIALVSIILRFVWPEYYAIYSRPPLKILRIERGIDDSEEYLNYVQTLRLLKQSFGVTKISEVDMIVWVVSQEKNEYLRELTKLLANQLPENLTPEELLHYLQDNPAKIAEVYYRKGAYKTSGMWVATAFEKFLQDECKRLKLSIPRKKNGKIQNLLNSLSRTDEYWYKRETMKDLKGLRNKAVHESGTFTKNDALKFLEIFNFFMSKRK